MVSGTVFITGSSGLIGSEAVRCFHRCGYEIHGIDNNFRQHFFGTEADTTRNLESLKRETNGFQHHDMDIRNTESVETLVKEIKPDFLLHCAAQPAHEYACEHPDIDFHVNVAGTVNLLEACRKYCPESPFVFCSSSKVYGPINEVPYVEQPNRFDFPDEEEASLYTNPNLKTGWSHNGIDETFPLEPGEGRGIYGTGKASADLLVQEYGLTFGMPTVCLRGNCMTGSAHAAVQVHGFLAYLVKCLMEERTYTIFGFKGKQVRDIIHAVDFINAMYMICLAPPKPGTVYNLGGGRKNSVSIREAANILEDLSGKTLHAQYLDRPRHGDHRVYISDNSKFRHDYPGWGIKWPFREICLDLIDSFKRRTAAKKEEKPQITQINAD